VSELTVRPSGPLAGTVRVPGDKSISHRAVMLSAVAEGTTRVGGLLFSDDVRSTMSAFRAMGVAMEESGGTLAVHGRGPGALVSPSAALDLGNSGTSLRLLTGLLAGLPLIATNLPMFEVCSRISSLLEGGSHGR